MKASLYPVLSSFSLFYSCSRTFHTPALAYLRTSEKSASTHWARLKIHTAHTERSVCANINRCGEREKRARQLGRANARDCEADRPGTCFFIRESTTPSLAQLFFSSAPRCDARVCVCIIYVRPMLVGYVPRDRRIDIGLDRMLRLAENCWLLQVLLNYVNLMFFFRFLNNNKPLAPLYFFEIIYFTICIMRRRRFFPRLSYVSFTYSTCSLLNTVYNRVKVNKETNLFPVFTFFFDYSPGKVQQFQVFVLLIFY